MLALAHCVFDFLFEIVDVASPKVLSEHVDALVLLLMRALSSQPLQREAARCACQIAARKVCLFRIRRCGNMPIGGHGLFSKIFPKEPKCVAVDAEEEVWTY